ncbi:hypothetical protein AVEN_183468-1 [Araneus ventricosus]|uniref:Uncharacterized protein n=1 Tax=Araneus ventricosus TaxID=182803 RepID=A0A4Y2TTL2_ARAVE|nr:hypothetical protein AVEN_183468-1 [Araneus ventricosus]
MPAVLLRLIVTRRAFAHGVEHDAGDTAIKRLPNCYTKVYYALRSPTPSVAALPLGFECRWRLLCPTRAFATQRECSVQAQPPPSTKKCLSLFRF